MTILVVKWDVKLGIISKPRDLWRELASLVFGLEGRRTSQDQPGPARTHWMHVA